MISVIVHVYMCMYSVLYLFLWYERFEEAVQYPHEGTGEVTIDSGDNLFGIFANELDTEL